MSRGPTTPRKYRGRSMYVAEPEQIAAVSFWNSEKKGFTHKKFITVKDLNADFEWSYDLKHGGKIHFFRNLIFPKDCPELRNEIDTKAPLRQHKFNRYQENRIHVLLHSLATNDTSVAQPGYEYHGTTMRAKPLLDLPLIHHLSDSLAQKFEIKDNLWGVGVNVIIYRDGTDGIGWHADDTQKEKVVVSVTVGSPKSPRCIQIRPKKEQGQTFQDGDERIELFPAEGDGYTMDGIMQQNYEHRVPPGQRESAIGKRYTLIFRDGDVKMVEKDSGNLADISDPKPRQELVFGAHTAVYEGGLYKRSEIFDSGAHRADRRGVSGNAMVGCNSIVISEQDDPELDRFGIFGYNATTKQGARALHQSMLKKQTVRVFRNEKKKNCPFAASRKQVPRKRGTPVDKSAVYRYDGLYNIVGVLDSKQNDATDQPLSTKETYRFILQRAPKSKNGNEYTDEQFLYHFITYVKTIRKRAWFDPKLFLNRNITTRRRAKSIVEYFRAFK